MAQSLLEPVAAGQTRFRMQGLAPDARGIVVGREMLVAFPTVERLVSFLGAYSDEASLDDLIPTMTLERARRDGGGHAFLLRCAAADAYAIDRVARIAQATRGEVYTGSGSTFVRWRQREAPFGYDLVDPIGSGSEDLLVVDVDYLSRYHVSERLDPAELVTRLQLRPDPLPLRGIGQDPELCGLKEMALVLVAPGLSERVLHYLWQLDVAMAGYGCVLEGDRRPSLLVRLRAPQPRVLEVLHGTPGVELLVPVSPRAAVEVGYRHPIHLASASSCFPGDEMFLFRGTAGRVERLDGPPRFVDGRHLVERGEGLALHDTGHLEEHQLEPLRVELQLRPSATPSEPRAVLIDWGHAALLRKLVYLIPPSALAASRVVLLPEGIVVLTGAMVAARAAVSSVGLGVGALVPMGKRLVELAPGVLVPDGWELWPRVRAQLLRQLLGLEADDHAIFLDPEQPAVRVPASRLLALDAALIGRLELEEGEAVTPELPALEAPKLDNARMGRFALWGFGNRETGTSHDRESEG